MKLTSTLLVALSVVSLCSCKPKEQAKRESRFEWNTATALNAYEKHGSKNPNWDKDAKKCLEEYVRMRGNIAITNYDERARTFQLVGTYASSAINNGCDDPLIEYLFCRFAQGIKGEELKTKLCTAADKMQNTAYAPVRKFYANFRAAEALWKDRDKSVWDRVAQYERVAINNFIEMANDKSTPIEELDEAGHEILRFLRMQDWALKMIIDGAEPALLKHWGGEDATHAIRGLLYYQYAWTARGGGYANKVTEEGWKGFRDHIATATAAAEKAWAINPKNTRIPKLMVDLAKVSQKPREEMELWFSRAMELEPNNNDVCNAKLHYLYPQWYGSVEEMLEFGRECVASDKWFGSVPLTLVNAHDEICNFIRDKHEQAEYWKQPDVWKDIQSAFEKFFELNPEASGWRHNYAKYAYACEQWETLNQQLKLLGDVNYSYFGGRDAFDKMVQLAQENDEPSKDAK